MKVLFWNIHKNSGLTRLVSQIVADEDIDIVALVEADFSGEDLQRKLSKHGVGAGFRPMATSADRFAIVSKIKYQRLYDSTYALIYKMNPELYESFFLVFVHLPSKLHVKNEGHFALSIRISNELAQCEDQYEIQRSIVVGDFTEYLKWREQESELPKSVQAECSWLSIFGAYEHPD